MKTTKEVLSTKEQLLQKATELMLAKGFTAVTVDEICKKTGITKGGFFHYFKSKEDLGKSALEYYWQLQMQMIQNMPFKAIKDPLKKLHAFLDSFEALANNPHVSKSCLIGNFSQELAATNPGIQALCKEKFSLFAGMLKQILDKAKQMYAPRSRLDTKSLAEHFVALFQGSLILAKAKNNTQVIEEGIRHFRRYVISLFKT
ncbi:MAG: TetR/AcrR family transcriptional regulator [Candidatus Omnitrophica bacterium]|nr:TetR/AcrR family transcriptional regulator [Candidatus Omnitrophota bacterium]